jgi:DNA polymerase-3 subunit epsilon
LANKPRFEDVVQDFLEFIAGSELVIHNAEFDVGFLNYELGLLGPAFGRIDRHAGVLDTLKMARDLYPGQRNSLDALCKRLGVDNKHRQLHGALLDAELLTDVYLAMTSGQTGFGFDEALPAADMASTEVVVAVTASAFMLHATPAELEAHQSRIQKIADKSGKSLWAD